MATIVAAPDRAPLAGGLFSALTFESAGRWETGVTFPGQTCGLLLVTSGPGCVPEEDLPEFGFDRELPWGEIPETFTVSGQFSCSPVGTTVEEAEDHAVEDLQRHEEATVEEWLWVEKLSAAEALTSPAGPVGPKVGLGALEHYAGRTYGGRGVIHAPRWMIPALDVETRGGRLVTKALGTPVVAGSGYGDPGEVSTIVVTPSILAYRSPVELVGDRSAQVNTRRNLLNVLAQRTYLIGLDTCPPASIQIDLTT